MILNTNGKIIRPAFCLGATLMRALSMAAEDSTLLMPESTWTMSIDNGYKPVGIFKPFMTLEPDHKDRITEIRLDILPNNSKIADLFSDAEHQHYRYVALSCPSRFCLSGRVTHGDELMNVVEIVNNLNALYEARFEEMKARRVAQDTAKALRMGKGRVEGRKIILSRSAKFVLPLWLSQNTEIQPNRFYILFDFTNHKYIKIIFKQLQIIDPELKSDMFDEALQVIQERI